MCAESSLLWTTNGTGDGSSGGYTQAQTTDWMEALVIGDNTDEGVLNGYLNSLEVTASGGTASPVTIDTGGAYVKGFPYFNSSAGTKNIPTPAGNTRVDRIVLRASWSAQTVRFTRIAGTEGAGAPSLTQSDGVTWDIPLAQVSITTGGVATVTDQRVYVHPNIEIEAGNIASGAVTNAKLGADSVDDTKVGNRVPQFYRRQGGDSGDWSVAGTATYTPTTVRMQSGAHQFSITADAGTWAADTDIITFPQAYSAKPQVLVTMGDSNVVTATISRRAPMQWNANTIATNQFQLTVRAFDLADDWHGTAHWLAIGPE